MSTNLGELHAGGEEDERVYCWAAFLQGNRYLIFQFFEGPLQTDLGQRKDPDFLIYRYEIDSDVLRMYDLDQRTRKRIARRLGVKTEDDFSHSEMQKELLKIRNNQWDLHVCAERQR